MLPAVMLMSNVPVLLAGTLFNNVYSTEFGDPNVHQIMMMLIVGSILVLGPAMSKPVLSARSAIQSKYKTI